MARASSRNGIPSGARNPMRVYPISESPYLLHSTNDQLSSDTFSHKHQKSSPTSSNHPARRRCSEEVNERAWILHCHYFSEQDWLDSCVKHSIFIKYGSFESIFLSIT